MLLNTLNLLLFCFLTQNRKEYNIIKTRHFFFFMIFIPHFKESFFSYFFSSEITQTFNHASSSIYLTFIFLYVSQIFFWEGYVKRGFFLFCSHYWNQIKEYRFYNILHFFYVYAQIMYADKISPKNPYIFNNPYNSSRQLHHVIFVIFYSYPP